jgi:hypothetical protein
LHKPAGGRRGGGDEEGDGVTADDELQELLDIIESRQPEQVKAARREYEQRLTNAWKKPYKARSSLAILIQDPDVPIERVAAVLCAECAKRGRGKPGGAHWRWTKPHYLIAWFIEQSGAEPTDAYISTWIDIANGWKMMHDRQRLDPQHGSRDVLRVRELLRGSKRRRL